MKYIFIAIAPIWSGSACSVGLDFMALTIEDYLMPNTYI